MEAKTMGSFLAALRKAAGMTQRELAERLHVSDKAVSRWERDECAPDLALLPVLAEIFPYPVMSCSGEAGPSPRSPTIRPRLRSSGSGF